MLEKRVIAQRLQSLQWVNQRRERGPRVPLSQLAAFLGVSRPTIYAALRGKVSERTQIRLSILLERIAAGELGFRRDGRVWEVAPPVLTGLPPIRMQVSITASGFPQLSFIPRPEQLLPRTLTEVFKRQH